ncbi:unnamed protein product [Amoebophrya sp. A120]|nr:unnamed protein product [Amoebophrya sp. A120]|eukprot:GSA120T00006635001.1
MSVLASFLFCLLKRTDMVSKCGLLPRDSMNKLFQACKTLPQNIILFRSVFQGIFSFLYAGKQVSTNASRKRVSLRIHTVLTSFSAFQLLKKLLFAPVLVSYLYLCLSSLPFFEDTVCTRTGVVSALGLSLRKKKAATTYKISTNISRPVSGEERKARGDVVLDSGELTPTVTDPYEEEVVLENRYNALRQLQRNLKKTTGEQGDNKFHHSDTSLTLASTATGGSATEFESSEFGDPDESDDEQLRKGQSAAFLDSSSSSAEDQDHTRTRVAVSSRSRPGGAPALFSSTPASSVEGLFSSDRVVNDCADGTSLLSGALASHSSSSAALSLLCKNNSTGTSSVFTPSSRTKIAQLRPTQEIIDEEEQEEVALHQPAQEITDEEEQEETVLRQPEEEEEVAGAADHAEELREPETESLDSSKRSLLTASVQDLGAIATGEDEMGATPAELPLSFSVDVEQEREEYILRKLQPDDFAKGFKELLAQLSDPGDLDDEKFRALLAVTNTHVLVVEHPKSGRVVCSAGLLVEQKFLRGGRKVGHVEDVVTSEKFRRRGLAKKVILSLLEIAKEENCYKVILDCTESNSEVYKKMGFFSTGEIQMRYNL